MFNIIFVVLTIASCVFTQEDGYVPDNPPIIPSNLDLEAALLPNESLPIQSQIYGGVPVDIENYPYQVQILLNAGFRCGGSILSKKSILTAAHCVNGIASSTLSVRAGSSYKRGGTVVRVGSYIRHPDFKQDTLDYDVAVITLAKDLIYGPGIGRIDLTNISPADGTRLTVTGWGNLYQGGPTPDQLQMARVQKVSWWYCVRRYYLTSRMLCAGYGYQGTCNGDSGGPLTASGKQVGIVSHGKDCNRVGYPEVYTSIAELYSWIRSYVLFD